MEQGLSVFFYLIFSILQVWIFCHSIHNTPGQEGLVLLYCVHFVGGGVTPLAWQLPLGVITRTGTRDVDVTTAEVAAALQSWRGGPVPTVDNDARREEVLILWGGH